MRSENLPEPPLLSYLPFRIGSTGLAIRSNRVWMILHGPTIEPVEGAPDCMAGKMPFYNGHVPVLNLGRKLPFTLASSGSKALWILMVSYPSPNAAQKNSFLGLPVDQLMGTHQISAEKIRSHQPLKRYTLSGKIAGTTVIHGENFRIIEPANLLTPGELQKCLEACQ
jgi:chemotaxis signal transduction protein